MKILDKDFLKYFFEGTEDGPVSLIHITTPPESSLLKCLFFPLHLY